MIRRLSVALAAVALTSTVASGCSTFTKNTQAAKVGSTSLSIDDFEALIDGLSTAQMITPADNGEWTSPAVRSVLTRWIAARLVEDRLAAAGTPISDENRATATSALKEEATVKYDSLNPFTQSFLVTELAGQLSLNIPEADLQRTYELGVIESNLLCLRVAVLTDQDEADEAYQQILDGEAQFGDIADANNPDGAGVGEGGVLTSPTTGSECLSTSELNPQVAQSLASVDIGVPSEPAEFSASDGSPQYVMFLQRPWDEVKDSAGPALRQVLGPGIERRLISGGKAVVDSRYGVWDPTALIVQPAR